MSEQYTETVVIVRPSFKKITAKEEKTDACRAALFNHFLYWIARKAKGATVEQVQNGEFSWWATEDQIASDGLGDAWCKKKVSKEIDLLVESGLVGRRRNPANKWDQTRHYYLSEKEGAKIKEYCVNAGICLNHLGLSPCVVQLLESLNAIGQYSIWKCQICQMTNGKCTTAIPKVSTKVSTKGVVVVSPTVQQPERDTPTFSENDLSDAELLALCQKRNLLPKVDDYTTSPTIDTDGQPSMQLSTQANGVSTHDVHNSQSENGSQSYSHRQDTSPATNVGKMGVLAVPMPPVSGEVVIPPTTTVQPASEDLEEKKRLGKMTETIKRLAHIDYVALPALKFLDAWGKSEYGPCSLNTWEVSSAIAIVEQMNGTIEDALLVAKALKAKGVTVKVEAVYNSWSLLRDLKKVKPPSPKQETRIDETYVIPKFIKPSDEYRRRRAL